MVGKAPPPPVVACCSMRYKRRTEPPAAPDPPEEACISVTSPESPTRLSPQRAVPVTSPRRDSVPAPASPAEPPDPGVSEAASACPGRLRNARVARTPAATAWTLARTPPLRPRTLAACPCRNGPDPPRPPPHHPEPPPASRRAPSDYLGARFRVSFAVVAVPPLGARRSVTVALACFASSCLPRRFSFTLTFPLAPAASL